MYNNLTFLSNPVNGAQLLISLTLRTFSVGSIYERKYDDICHPIISFEYMGSRCVGKPPIDRMFTFKPKDLEDVWDSGETQIFIKNGAKKRFEWIISENESKYEPFAWLFDLFDEVSKVIPYEVLDDNNNWVDVRKYNEELHPEMFESEE